MEVNVIEYPFANLEIYQLFLSILSFDRVIVAHIVVMMVDISGFSTSRELVVNFGVVPKIRESAETSHDCGTTHRGDEQAVFVHVSIVEDWSS